MDPKTKQKVLRLLTNGMYVITSRSGERYGAATITWVSQASFKPPLLMVALRKDGSVFQCLVESRIAVLHVLDQRTAETSHRNFSPRPNSRTASLNGEPYSEGKTRAPILDNLGAYLECKVVEIIEEHGDHAVAILEATRSRNSQRHSAVNRYRFALAIRRLSDKLHQSRSRRAPIESRLSDARQLNYN